MVDLARQAFCTNNFGLAVEIYERAIKEKGPQTDLYLGLADSFARGGQFTKAFDAYTRAFRLGKVGPEKLEHLVTALLESQRQDSSGSGTQRGPMAKSCMFTCVLCRGLLNEPITISCGHTFCRKCLERERTKTYNGPTCQVCGIVHYRLKPSNIQTNILLANLILKWFPDRCKAVKLKVEGNKHFERNDFQRAIASYSEAISLYDADHLLFSNRSHAYASLHQYDKALEDAERVVRMRPDWPKGFFRKGTALFELGLYADAAMAFLQCLTLDKDVALAKDNLLRSLHKVLSRPPPDNPKDVERQGEYNLNLFQHLLSSSSVVSDCQSHVTTNTLNHLHQVMDEVVTEALHCQPSLQDSKCSEMSPCGKNSELAMEVECSGTLGLMNGKQRCHSVPSLEQLPSDSLNHYLRQRSRSQSPKRNSEISESRKRCHLPSAAQPQSPTHHSLQKSSKSETEASGWVADGVQVSQSLLSAGDLDCNLCFRLLYQPVTTPCGHTFCKECLERCLDHRTSCPMCKSCLAEYLAERRSAVTEALQLIISTYFPTEFMQRQQIHEEEINELANMGLDNQHEIPVFVCTLGFPRVLCPLHIFEPRYRLMIRQCMESGTRQFGMCACLSDNEGDFSDYGCMLEVRDVHFFPDGRSLVDTVGGRRFHVLSRGKRDGYNTAKVEFLEDKPFDESERAEIQSLQNEIYMSIQNWLDRLPVFRKSLICQHFGNIPDIDPDPGANPNGPAWAWWCTAVLPLDPAFQLTLLAMCSYKERLEALRRVLSHLNHGH